MRDLLRIRDFRLLFIGQAGSTWGDALTNLALLILTQRLTGSVAAVAGTAIAVALPQLLFGLPAGALVDRWDRKKVMVAADMLRALLVIGFALVNSTGRIWLMYVLAFTQAGISVFFNPARGVLVPAIVKPDRLLAANSSMETSRIVFGLLGTAAAGVWAGVSADMRLLFVLDSLTFIASACLVQAIRTPSEPAKAGAAQTGMRNELVEGFRNILGSRVLLGVLIGAGIFMFGVGAVNVLLVTFLIDELAVSETWFGILEAAQVSSMVMSGALLATLAARIRPTRTIPMALIGSGLVVAAITAVRTPWQLMILLFAVGWLITPLQASITTIVQTEVNHEMLGRVGSLLNTVTGSANVGSMTLAGVAATQLGVRSVFLICGAIVMAAGLATASVFTVAENFKGRNLKGDFTSE